MWKTAGFFPLAVALLVVTASAIPTDTDKVAKLVGVAECVDCRTNDFKGILLAVACNSETNQEDYKEVAFGEFGGDGKLSLRIPTKLVDRECVAHVRSTSKTNPCPTLQHPDNFTLSPSSEDQSVYFIGTGSGKIPFSRAACGQKTFFNIPYFKCPDHPWFKYLPYCNKKPTHKSHHKNPPPCPPPVYKKPPPYKPPVHKNHHLHATSPQETTTLHATSPQEPTTLHATSPQEPTTYMPPVHKKTPPCNPPPY